MSRLVVCVLLLLVAPASAQGFVDATLELRVPLDPAGFQEFNPERTDTAQNAVSPCNTGHMRTSADGRGLRFLEESTEQGCAQAWMLVDVPAGAAAVEVHFDATKSVLQPATATVADVAISVRTEVFLSQTETPSPVRFMDPAARREVLTDHVISHPLTGVGPLNVTWHFDDEGPTVRSGIPGPVFGQRVEVDIIEPRLWFTGIPLASAQDVEVQQGSVDAAEATEMLHVRFPIHEAGASRVTARAQVGTELYQVIRPDGASIPIESLGQGTLEGNLQVLRLDADLFATHGPGVYTLVYTAATPLEANPFLVPLIGALIVVPAILGVFATRSARFLVQEARGSFRVTARALRISLFSVWGIYAAGLLFLFLARWWPMVVSWPIQPQAAMLHGLFVFTAAAFIALGFYWRRRLAHAMAADLQAKAVANQALSRSNEELQQFAYVASHDLQEPLRTIGRFAELVQHRYGDQLDDDGREFLGYTVDGAKRMQVLIDGLLAFSRVDSKGREPEAVALDDVVQRVLRALEARIVDEGAAMEVGNLPIVKADPIQVGQLMQNLIGNALKFRDPDRPPRVQIRAIHDGGMWRVEVEDNGIGIDPKYHDRIFTVFQRLHRREDYDGTGIGLAICKKIVQRHGGHLGLRSSPGQGATFFFTLPSEKVR